MAHWGRTTYIVNGAKWLAHFDKHLSTHFMLLNSSGHEDRYKITSYLLNKYFKGKSEVEINEWYCSLSSTSLPKSPSPWSKNYGQA